MAGGNGADDDERVAARDTGGRDDALGSNGNGDDPFADPIDPADDVETSER